MLKTRVMAIPLPFLCILVMLIGVVCCRKLTLISFILVKPIFLIITKNNKKDEKKKKTVAIIIKINKNYIENYKIKKY